MTTIERLFEYLDYKQIKPTRFEKDIGLSNGYLGIQLRRKADIGSGILVKIVDNCLDLDIEWLITGKGSMLRNSIQEVAEAAKYFKSNSSYTKDDRPPGPCQQCLLRDKIIETQADTIESLKARILEIESKKRKVG